MKFGVILADPPWRYETAKPGQAIEDHYPTMTLKEIRMMPIEQHAEADCVLFLWTTAPKLEEGLSVVNAWGFTYRTCMVWHKTGLGMGYYWRVDHELLLLGIRGKPGTPKPENRPRSVLKAPKGRHSAKPWQVHAMIEAMYPNAERLELFCRHPQPGWHSWGNGVVPNLLNGPILALDELNEGKKDQKDPFADEE